jgi:hypothetical protein
MAVTVRGFFNGVNMRKSRDLVGMKFGRLAVIKFSHCDRHSKKCWLAKCDCGKEKTIAGQDMISGHTKSCGCLQRDLMSTHRMARTPIYQTWERIKQRCLNKNWPHYSYYGGRGIKICDRWLGSFENFYEDMGGKPKGMSIERKDNDGNYEIENCKWATNREQNRNKRSNVFISYNNETLCLSDWATKLGISRSTLRYRVSIAKWPVELAFIPPKQ